GQLTVSGTAANTTCDFQFGLFGAATGGTAIGTQTQNGISVANGFFSVVLDFGVNAFAGSDRWLEIGVKCGDDSSFTTLTPRQQLTSVPYATYASSVPWSGVIGAP
ncbi:hypothetical protein V6O07_16990, partial [Arthrospira platensis SPKY2]